MSILFLVEDVVYKQVKRVVLLIKGNLLGWEIRIFIKVYQSMREQIDYKGGKYKELYPTIL